MHGSSDEFASFVGEVVSLDEVGRQDSGPRFDDLMGRIAGNGGSGGSPLYSALGGGLLVVAGLLAMLLPGSDSIRSSHFWRVARSIGAELAGIGSGAALPLIVTGVLLLAGGLLLTYRLRTGSSATVWFSQAGMVGLGLVALMWGAIAVLWLLNLVVLLLIIVAYVVAGIIVIGMFIGLLGGLANA